ncbi:hypothetical protein ACJX0J_017181, partial [Zea mays]
MPWLVREREREIPGIIYAGGWIQYIAVYIGITLAADDVVVEVPAVSTTAMQSLFFFQRQLETKESREQTLEGEKRKREKMVIIYTETFQLRILLIWKKPFFINYHIINIKIVKSLVGHVNVFFQLS